MYKRLIAIKNAYGIKKMSIVFIMFFFSVFNAGEEQKSLSGFCEPSGLRAVLLEDMIGYTEGIQLIILYNDCNVRMLDF